MKSLLKSAVLAAVTLTLVSVPFQARAQDQGGRPRFDPAQMRERMMEMYKQRLDVKSDDEWKVIEPRVEKVTQARREIGFGGAGMRGMFGPGRRGGGDNADSNQGNRRRGGFGGEPSAAAQELQKAVDSNASADTIKTKLAAYRAEHQQKLADLQKAQEELKKVLSVKQEAAAVLVGLLD